MKTRQAGLRCRHVFDDNAATVIKCEMYEELRAYAVISALRIVRAIRV